AARARGVKVLLRIALDLRCSALTRLNLVSEAAELVGKMGLIDGGRVALRLEETPLLKRPHLPILALGHIEDDDMRVELWRGVAIDRAGCIVLELGSDKLSGHLGRAIPANSGLRVSLQLIQSNIHGLLVNLTHTFIAANKRGQRNRLGCAERGIP